MTYKEKLLDPRWQKKRLLVLNRDGFSCKLCKNDMNTLHVHHKSYASNPWDSPDEELDTYCATCHNIISIINNHSKEQILFSFYGRAFMRCFVMYDRITNEKMMYVFDVHQKTPNLVFVIDESDLSEMIKVFTGEKNG